VQLDPEARLEIAIQHALAVQFENTTLRKTTQ